MPEELRPRLVDAAARAGRSLNAELVHRLERSLEENPTPDRRYFGRMKRPRSTRQGRRQLMTRRRKRLALSGFAALVLVAAATAFAVLSASGGASEAARGEAETPPALAAHLAQLK
jgi:hypothetical protein